MCAASAKIAVVIQANCGALVMHAENCCREWTDCMGLPSARHVSHAHAGVGSAFSLAQRTKCAPARLALAPFRAAAPPSVAIVEDTPTDIITEACPASPNAAELAARALRQGRSAAVRCRSIMGTAAGALLSAMRCESKQNAPTFLRSVLHASGIHVDCSGKDLGCL